MNYCPACGSKVQQAAKFCAECGSALQLSHQPLHPEEDVPHKADRIRWVDRIDRYLVTDNGDSASMPIKAHLLQIANAKDLDSLILDIIFTSDGFYLKPAGKINILPAAIGTLLVGGTFGMWEEFNRRFATKVVAKDPGLDGLGELPSELGRSLPYWSNHALVKVEESMPSWGNRGITTFKFTGTCALNGIQHDGVSIFFILNGSASPSKNQNLTFTTIAPLLGKSLRDVARRK